MRALSLSSQPKPHHTALLPLSISLPPAMAPPKKALPNQPPPPKPEEDKEEEESSEEEEESAAEEEESDVEVEKEKEKEKLITPQNETSDVNKKPTVVEKQTTAPPPPQSPSDEESEGGSDSEKEELEEEQHSPSATSFTIRAISPKKLTSKDSKRTSKRPSETLKSDENESRSKKKAKGGEEEMKKVKPLAISTPASGGLGTGRVWTEEDEIRVLHGLIDYERQKGTDPSADMGAFYEFVKGKLQAEFTKVQVYKKVRRLKQKFLKNVGKIRNGEDIVFDKPHDGECYDLSKRIWGIGMIINVVEEKEKVQVNSNVNGKSDSGKRNKSGKVVSFVGSAKKDDKLDKKNVENEEVKNDGGGTSEENNTFTTLAYNSIRGLITADQISLLKENMRVIGSATTSREFEEKWKKVREEETEMLLKKLHVLTDHTKWVLDEIRKM